MSPLLPLLGIGGTFGVVAVRQTLFICNKETTIDPRYLGDHRSMCLMIDEKPKGEKKTEVSIEDVLKVLNSEQNFPS